MNWANPDDWLDLVAYAWYGLVLIAIAGVPSWFAARNHRGISDIKNQVVNGHKSPMRSDLDLVLQSIDVLSTDIRGLRQDLSEERNTRRTAVADLYTELDHRTGRHRRD